MRKQNADEEHYVGAAAAASAAVPTEALGGVAELQRDSRQRPQNRYRRPRSSGGDLLCATCSVPH